MNYSKIYTALINKAKERKTSAEGYTELHHIIPKAIGGTNVADNLVRLYAREHYLAHLLLSKMYPNNAKLVAAVVLMGSQVGSTSRTYAIARANFAKNQSIAQSGENNSQYGTRWVFSLDRKESKRIRVDDPIPEGFKFGRVINFDKKLETISKKEAKIAEAIALYTKLYKVYSTYGWLEMVRITGYDKSHPNFVKMCYKYVKEYVPQNGKKRGS